MQPFCAATVPLRGFNLVEASAGTGKTFAITTVVLRQILEQKLGLDQIVAVTFTEAATAELRARVRKRLVEAMQVMRGERPADQVDPDLRVLLERQEDQKEAGRRLEQALRDVDLAPIFTIHGFCARMIADCAFETGLLPDVRLRPDVSDVLMEIASDWWTNTTQGVNEDLLAALETAGLAPNKVTKLMENALRCPDQLLVPDLSDCNSSSDHQAYQTAIEGLRAVWQSEAVRAKIASGNLKKTSFKESLIDEYVTTVDHWLLHPRSGPLPRGFGRLTPAFLSKSTLRGKTTPEDDAFVACEALCKSKESYDAGLAMEALKYKFDLVSGLRERFWKRKLADGYMTFDDQLLLLRNALDRSPGLAADLRARYPVALVDEFQDTDAVQWAIFRTIWASSNLFIIGDPKQAVYSFRGADIHTYLRARAEVPEPRRFTMETNYRSDPSLVRAVNALFLGPVPMLHDGIPFPEVVANAQHDAFEPQGALARRKGAAAPLQFRFFPSGDSKRPLPSTNTIAVVARQLAAELVELFLSNSRIDGRPIHPGDVAVLTRDNKQAVVVSQALREAGIAAVLMSQGSIYASEEATQLMQLLQAVSHPDEPRLVRAALAGQLAGESAVSLARMRQGDDPQAMNRWDSWLRLFRELNELWRERGFMSMYSLLVARLRLHARLLMRVDGDRVLTNLSHLAELLHTAATMEQLLPVGVVGWLKERVAGNNDGRDEEPVRLESDERAVKVCTIHKSKGLQFPVVYCPFLWKGRESEPGSYLSYHDQEGQKCFELLSGAEAKKDLEGRYGFHEARCSGREEELRLIYVALTRAENRCVVWWGSLNGFGLSPLAYLLHARYRMPPRSRQENDLSAWRSLTRALSDDEILHDLDALCERALHTIAWRGLDPDCPSATLPSEPVAAGPVLSCRISEGGFDRTFRLASFSQLSEGPQGRVVDARDRDSGEQNQGVTEPRTQELEPVDAGALAEVPLATFPRGARAGNFFHEVLEHLDFRSSDEERRGLVATTLRAHRFDDSLLPLCLEGLELVLNSDLGLVDRPGFRLGELAKEARLDEFEFWFPVNNTLPRQGSQTESTDRAEATLRPDNLARVFEANPSPALGSGYGARLRRLGFAPLRGFLKGYIDLIFCEQGRYYVVDYKSNYLGDKQADYGQAALAHCMRSKHFVLQGHLYALAVHRYLRWQLADYNYEDHFGGIAYLFLRGMTATEKGAGVYFEKPPKARIDDLDALLSGASEAQ